METDLRVEWLKCRARANRWREEIILVEEEMGRSLEYCTYLHNWWLQRPGFRTTNSFQLQEGLKAYAAEMADMEDRRGISWAFTWATIRERAKVIRENYLSNNLKDADDGFLIPKLTVELDIEEDQDIYDELSEPEY